MRDTMKYALKIVGALVALVAVVAAIPWVFCLLGNYSDFVYDVMNPR